MGGRNLHRNSGYIFTISRISDQFSEPSQIILLFSRERNYKTPIMKLIIAFAAVVAVVLAKPSPAHVQDNSQTVVVKETPLDNIGIDGYQFGYELSNGQAHQESAQLVNVGQENESLAVRGSFTYVDPETNVRYTVNYIADENGFQPQGEHLPAV
ncbi:flexible cuticle protein 12-like [Anoplolepis gracilipes]|uniref:flexible cuticle protein 12-like n=1 Tax=Anoplolepis gracilipes TaxID=354296 RepID=UPI003B9E19C8